MRNTLRLSLALFPATCLALAACGGGEDDSGLSFRASDLNKNSAIVASGGNPPDVSPAQAKSQQLAIYYGANISHESRTIEVDWDGNVQTSGGGKRRIDCDPSTCDFGDTEFVPVMTKNGVRLAESSEQVSLSDGGVETTHGYGGWMDYSLFVVLLHVETYDGGSFVNWVTGYSGAMGYAPQTNPVTGTFAWNGVMIGRNSDIGDASVSNVIQGEAAVSGELSRGGDLSVDVAFTNIRDLSSGDSLADMSWADISVTDGSFDGRTIEGSFYGPQHEEVAGVFERNYIVGAFGARR